MLWAISCYFNPLAYRTKKLNYDLFRAHLAVPLLTVELAYEGGFALSGKDADRLIQVRGGGVLWQKERLLNLALQALPDECTAVAWIDADLIFANPDWPALTLKALERHSLVQPFHEILDLGQDQPLNEPMSEPTRRIAQRRSFASAYALGEVPEAYFAACGLSQPLALAPGGAWACRRALLEQSGFYDAMILGGGDKAMLHAMVGAIDGFIAGYRLGPEHARHYRAWAEVFHRNAPAGPGHVEGRLTHLWHGELSERGYRDRPALLAAWDFDPTRDIAHRPQSVWHWASDKPGLHAAVRRYFESRREEGEPAPEAFALNQPPHPL